MYSKAFFVLITSSLVLQTFGNLSLTRYSETSINSSVTKLICESNEDDGALIWNHDDLPAFREESNDPTNFLPQKWSQCAITTSTGCLVKWENRTRWRTVNSAAEPMGPVFDYRWKGFKETILNKSGAGSGLEYITEIQPYLDVRSLVFSVRTLENVNLFICKEKNYTKGPCLWIVIGGWGGTGSAMRNCIEVTLDDRQRLSQSCGSLNKTKHKHGNVLDPYEWRTFRIKWSSKSGIQIFNHNESTPFLESIRNDLWVSMSHIWIGNNVVEARKVEARVRFHLYEYFTTNGSEETFLLTEKFNTPNNIFHIKMLIGLCPKCGINVSLEHINGSSIATSFVGDNKSVSGDLMNWRSVKVVWDLSGAHAHNIRTNIKLRIRTFLNGSGGTVRWAVGNIRLCNSVDSVRKSTIKIRKNMQPDTPWPTVKFQKLFYDESATVQFPDKIGFVNNETLRVDQSGSLISLEIPAVANAKHYHKVQVVVVIKGTLTCAHTLRNTSLLLNHTELVIDRYEPEEMIPKNFTIGANKPNNESLNCSLYFEEEYTIEVKVEYSVNVSKFIDRTSIILRDNQSGTLELVLFGIFSILGILLIIFLVWWWWKKFREQSPSNPIVSLAEVTPSTENLVPRPTLSRTRNVLAAIKKRVSSHIYANPNECDSRSVSIEYFEEYAKQASDNGVLLSQFLVFPRGLARPCVCGKLKENLPKNRDSNVIPYDDNRVVLQKISGDPHSDYINASYIPGYLNERAYIATQTPLKSTINDFWRMVWHEKVHVICMLTNVTDTSKIKCDQYWPEIGPKERYGTVKVTNLGHEVFSDYVITTLRISCQKWKRRVTHLQYTRWPHHGVPMHFQSLVTFLKKMDEHMTGNGPVVVHCRTGSGRTGTIILCDICLRQAAAERAIDVLAQATLLRENRVNMIDNPQQYLLAHIIIAESIESLPTLIPCTDDLPRIINKLMRKLPDHMERLSKAMWQERALFSLVAPQCPTPGDFTRQRLPELNSAYPEVVFFERISMTNGAKKSFVSVVSVDGVRVKKQYLASQIPTISTRSKFWRLIADKNVELVVILQNPDPGDPNSCGLMPRRSNIISVPYVQVEITNRNHDQEHFMIDTVQLTDTSEGEERLQPVTVLTCTEWGYGKHGVPPTPGVLVDIWRTTEKIPRKKGPTLVLCHDGITGCGLYLAMSFLLERMAVERECDVISAVRAVRKFRPEFVQGFDQFQYLYDTAVNYVKCFETYSNFA